MHPLTRCPRSAGATLFWQLPTGGCVRQCRGRRVRGDPAGVPSPAEDVDPRAFRHRSAQGRPLGVLDAARRYRPSEPPHHGFSVVPPKGNDPLIIFFAS
jgi:hypothetical protein